MNSMSEAIRRRVTWVVLLLCLLLASCGRGKPEAPWDDVRYPSAVMVPDKISQLDITLNGQKFGEQECVLTEGGSCKVDVVLKLKPGAVPDGLLPWVIVKCQPVGSDESAWADVGSTLGSRGSLQVQVFNFQRPKITEYCELKKLSDFGSGPGLYEARVFLQGIDGEYNKHHFIDYVAKGTVRLVPAEHQETGR